MAACSCRRDGSCSRQSGWIASRDRLELSPGDRKGRPDLQPKQVSCVPAKDLRQVIWMMQGSLTAVLKSKGTICQMTYTFASVSPPVQGGHTLLADLNGGIFCAFGMGPVMIHDAKK